MRTQPSNMIRIAGQAMAAARQLKNAGMKARDASIAYVAGENQDAEIDACILAVKGSYDRLVHSLRRLRNAAKKENQ